MFVATGVCGIAPLIHGLKVFGVSQMMRKALPYTLGKAICLLSGVSLYAVSLPSWPFGKCQDIKSDALAQTRFPESRYPGKFDLCGSHSIFHILVVCAAVVQLVGYLDAYHYAQEDRACSRSPHRPIGSYGRSDVGYG